MSPRIGALFAGYGGLDEGVRQVYGGEVAWYSEIDKGALKILGHRYPGVPNVGSVTEADWSQVEPVDVLTGGSPCQDLSHAGKRQGMTEGTRSNLWVAMREAIAQLRPQTVVWENVRGAFSAAADSEVEPCSGCVGDGSGVHLRALGRVLGDLSELGYDTRWHGLRAADVGAPHGRFRVFVVATDTRRSEGGPGHDLDLLGRRTKQAEQVGVGYHGPPAEGDLLSTPQARDYKGVPGDGFNSANLCRDVSLLPTPTTTQRGTDANLDIREGARANLHNEVVGLAGGALLPTPVVNDMGEGKTVEHWDQWTAKRHGNGNGHGPSLAIEAQRLLPTPRTGDGDKGGPNQAGSSGDLMLPSAVQPSRWGQYAAAVARWESVVGPAPSPTETGPKGSPRLSPRFSEWMMGLPAGWVTDVPGITRNEALKALGNGVVPQQAAEALRVMASWSEVAA